MDFFLRLVSVFADFIYVCLSHLYLCYCNTFEQLYWFSLWRSFLDKEFVCVKLLEIMSFNLQCESSIFSSYSTEQVLKTQMVFCSHDMIFESKYTAEHPKIMTDPCLITWMHWVYLLFRKSSTTAHTHYLFALWQ